MTDYNPFAKMSAINNVGILIQQGKLSLYKYIMTGTPEQILRKKYSWVVEYPVTGQVTEFPGYICIITGSYVCIDYKWLNNWTFVPCYSKEQWNTYYPDKAYWYPYVIEPLTGLLVCVPNNQVVEGNLMTDYFDDYYDSDEDNGSNENDENN